MRRLEVLQRSGAAEVEGVLANAAIARLVALAACDVGQPVFDRHKVSPRLNSAKNDDESLIQAV